MYTALVRSVGRALGWLGIAAAAGFVLAAAPALRPVRSTTEAYTIEAPAAFGSIPLEIHIDRPEWLRSGEAGTFRLEVSRSGEAGSPWPTLAGASAAAMVAGLRATGLEILPGEDQAAPLVDRANRLTYAWSLEGRDPGVAQVTLSLAWRHYLTAGGTSESLLWTRFVPLEVRRRSLSASTGLLGIAGGIGLWLVSRRMQMR